MNPNPGHSWICRSRNCQPGHAMDMPITELPARSCHGYADHGIASPVMPWHDHTIFAKLKRRILVAPLDWGLGHATRMIPVIRQIMELGAEPVLGASGGSLQLLREEFPMLESIALPAYQITYPSGKAMTWHMMKRLPGIFTTIRKEHQLLKKIIQSHQINAVISDNRFGLWNRSIPSVFVTHQLFIKASPGLQWTAPMIKYLNHYYISHFKECWIPDYPELPGLSGSLSHQKGIPRHCLFIGPLTRFETPQPDQSSSIQTNPYEILAILSGPEPQRTKLEELLKNQLRQLGKPSLMILGKPGNQSWDTSETTVHTVNHLPSEEFRHYLKTTGIVICRSGYSSIMDLAALEKNAILIPTPGQTEQEYLGRLHHRLHYCCTQNQSQLNLQSAIEELGKCAAWPRHEQIDYLKQRIQTLVGNL